MSSSASWTPEQAWQWHRGRPYRVGFNYLPRNAVNQLEMWQEATWSPDVIGEELDWAARIGFNSLRVFLHDRAWQSDPVGFLDRMEAFLRIADERGFRTLWVFFDSCWHPQPRPGPQRPPEPFVHNSGWLQSPGRAVLESGAFHELEPYVRAVLDRFGRDPRVEGWDLWNEPSNVGVGNYAPRDLGDRKPALVAEALALTLGWVRACRPDQPLTCGLWQRDLTGESPADLIELQLAASDVVSFHSYLPAEPTGALVERLRAHGRPLLCTEYMARSAGSTFESILPLLLNSGVGAYHWGLVAGRSQTIYPWDSWQVRYESEPEPWFHDLLRPDGSPYRETEVDFIRELLRAHR